jgi:hypothetical protein
MADATSARIPERNQYPVMLLTKSLVGSPQNVMAHSAETRQPPEAMNDMAIRTLRPYVRGFRKALKINTLAAVPIRNARRRDVAEGTTAPANNRTANVPRNLRGESPEREWDISVSLCIR